MGKKGSFHRAASVSSLSHFATVIINPLGRFAPTFGAGCPGMAGRAANYRYVWRIIITTASKFGAQPQRVKANERVSSRASIAGDPLRLGFALGVWILTREFLYFARNAWARVCAPHLHRLNETKYETRKTEYEYLLEMWPPRG